MINLSGDQIEHQSNPCQPWLSDKQWSIILELSKNLQEFNNLPQEIQDNPTQWQKIFESNNPYSTSENEWMPKYNNNNSSFLRLNLIKQIRPDKFIESIQQMILEFFDKSFIDFPLQDLNDIFEDHNQLKPIILILSSGTDPIKSVLQLAGKYGMVRSIIQLSMGKGQGDLIANQIQYAVEKGKWIYIQNCHLAQSFMGRLENIIDNLQTQTVHQNFRIWLTTLPFDKFPPSLLQSGSKITFESPHGIRNLVRQQFSYIKWEDIESTQKPMACKKMIFSLVFFHSVILERSKYGSLGWINKYRFQNNDFMISLSQIMMFLNKYDEIQWTALQYLIGEVFLQILGQLWRFLLLKILNNYLNPHILEHNYKFSESGTYGFPDILNLSNFKDYIKRLPINTEPELFGLHQNAEISAQIKASNNFCDQVLSILPRQLSQSGSQQDSDIIKIFTNILDKIPQSFNLKHVQNKAPLCYEQSLNTVLNQEVIRYNKLINTVRTSLKNLILAIDGIISINQDLEQIQNQIVDNKIPSQWVYVSFLTLKPLGSWIVSLQDRVQFFNNWIEKGIPIIFWVSALFFTQGLFTGVLQNYSRKQQLSIDTLGLGYCLVNEKENNYDISQKPEIGCFIEGLFLDGCKLNTETYLLDESDFNVLYQPMCKIYCLPDLQSNIKNQLKNKYSCPVYKTSQRQGTLLSSGHSTNYITNIHLPIKEDQSEQYWTIRGVAMLTQLDD